MIRTMPTNCPASANRASRFSLSLSLSLSSFFFFRHRSLYRKIAKLHLNNFSYFSPPIPLFPSLWNLGRSYVEPVRNLGEDLGIFLQSFADSDRIGDRGMKRGNRIRHCFVRHNAARRDDEPSIEHSRGVSRYGVWRMMVYLLSGVSPLLSSRYG